MRSPEEVSNNPDGTASDKQWKFVKRVGFLGKNRDSMYAAWNETYGVGNWRIGWQLSSGEQLNFNQIFQLYVDGYLAYFRNHPEEARAITENYAYCYDKTPISRDQAFQAEALVGQPGLPNQFHHVALNIALEQLDFEFIGNQALQVRDGKADQPKEEWPAGWQWGPGYIPAADASLIPDVAVSGWWQPGTIEDLYQKSKVLLYSTP